MNYLKLSLYINHDTSGKLRYIDHTRIHRPINDFTTHKQHIYTKHQNTNIYTITSTNRQHKRINTYIIFFYFLAVVTVLNFVKNK